MLVLPLPTSCAAVGARWWLLPSPLPSVCARVSVLDLALLLAIKIGVVYYHHSSYFLGRICFRVIVAPSVPVPWLFPDLFGAIECGACTGNPTAMACCAVHYRH
jgi:hypothetical protein